MAIETKVEIKHALIAPGQGSQQIGMGKELAQISPAATVVWQEADRFLSPRIGFQFTGLVWEAKRDGVDLDEVGASEQLKKTEIAQPTIITDSLARWAALKEQGLLEGADYHAGNSLGFVTSLVTSGALDIEGAVKLGQGRGEAFKYAVEHSPRTTLVALNNIPEEVVEEVVDRFDLSVCLINTDTQVVIGGEVEGEGKGVKAALRHLKEQMDPEEYKEKVAPLEVDAAFHSRHMAKAVPLYREVVKSIGVKSPTEGKLVSATTVSELGSQADIEDALVLQLTETEDWNGAIKYLVDQGVNKMTELSGSARLVSMNRRQYRGTIVDRVNIGTNGSELTAAMRWYALKEIKGGAAEDFKTKEDVVDFIRKFIADRIDGDESLFEDYSEETHFVNDANMDSQDLLALRAAIRAAVGKNVPDEEAAKNVTIGMAAEGIWKLINP